MLLVCYFCLIATFFGVYGGDYDQWCQKEQLFKPSISITQNRGGEELEAGGPKFYPTSQYSNIYVCFNGPAWLYFARHTPLGDVFHEPEFRVAQHECQAFNGRPGPGSHTDPLILMGIYLLGQDEDYRKPSIHLFTAPLYNNVTGFYENTTSIMTINNRQCTIIKGTSTKITVDPRPLDPQSYCKMPYQNIDYIYQKNTVAPGDPIKAIQPETVKDLLKNDNSLKTAGCEKEQAINDFNFTTWKNEINQTHLTCFSRLLEKWTKLQATWEKLGKEWETKTWTDKNDTLNRINL